MLTKIKNYYRPFFQYRNWIKYSIYTSIILLLILFDILTKIGVYQLYIDRFGSIPDDVVRINSNLYSFFGMINIRLSFNTGAAFSFLSNDSFGRIFLPLLSLVMFIVLFYFYTVYFDN